MSDSDASYDDYCASDDSDAMSGSDADEYLVLDDETYGDLAAGEDETPAVAYRSLDAADVRERQRDAVARVTAVLQIPPEEAAPLLRAHQWNVNHLNDSWFADEAGVRAKAGLEPPPSDYAASTSTSRGSPQLGSESLEGKQTCQVCFEGFTRTALTNCGCGHDFCEQCWSGYLEAKVDDGPSCLDARCPHAGCETRVPESFFTNETHTKLSAASRAKHARFSWRSFVDDNPRVKWCVAPGVEDVFPAVLGAEELSHHRARTARLACPRRVASGHGGAVRVPRVLRLPPVLHVRPPSVPPVRPRTERFRLKLFSRHRAPAWSPPPTRVTPR